VGSRGGQTDGGLHTSKGEGGGDGKKGLRTGGREQLKFDRTRQHVKRSCGGGVGETSSGKIGRYDQSQGRRMNLNMNRKKKKKERSEEGAK